MCLHVNVVQNANLSCAAAKVVMIAYQGSCAGKNYVEPGLGEGLVFLLAGMLV